MALSRDQKQAQVADLTEKLKTAQSVMFAHYIGLSVSDVNDLRSQLKDSGAEMKVAKKTLTKLAAKEAGMPELNDDSMAGPISLIFSYEDPLCGAQVAFKYGQEHDQVAIVGGIFDGKVLTKEEAVELAKMPSRDALLATFVGMMRSPLNTFASMCGSPLSGFARALSGMADKGGFVEEETPAPEPAAPAEDSAPPPEADTQNEEETKDDAPAEEATEAPVEEKAEAATEDSAPPPEADTQNAEKVEATDTTDDTPAKEAAEALQEPKAPTESDDESTLPTES